MNGFDLSYGDYDEMEQLISLTDLQADYILLLHICIWKNNQAPFYFDLIKILVDKIDNIDSQHNGVTALFLAAEKNQIDVCLYLIEIGGAVVNQMNANSHFPCHVAAQNNHVDILRLLFSQGANIDCLTDHQATPLFISAYEGNLEALKACIELGSKMELTTVQGVTALFISSERGHVDCTQFLFEIGAKTNVVRIDGHQAIHMAAQNNHVEMIKLLASFGVDIDCLTTEQKASPCIIAAYEGHVESLEACIELESDMELRTVQGVTALFIAIERGHVECTKYLLDKGADLRIQRDDNVTLLQMASQDTAILRLVLDHDRESPVISEDIIEDIQNEESKQMIIEEFDNRRRKVIFENFINHHIEYPIYREHIYSIAFPDTRVFPPCWLFAQKVSHRYYFKEVLFYLHLYIAKVNSKQTGTSNATSLEQNMNENDDKTYTIFNVMAGSIIEYLQPTKF